MEENEIIFFQEVNNELIQIYLDLKESINTALRDIRCYTFRINKGDKRLAFKTANVNHILTIDKNINQMWIKFTPNQVMPLDGFTIYNNAQYVIQRPQIIESAINSYQAQI